MEVSDRARSSELTGGEGFSYEDVVVAYYLTALLREEGGSGIEGPVTRVAVQQGARGEPLDDLVVDANPLAGPRRLSLQIKRQVTISAAASNEDFREIITNAAKTRGNPEFREGTDRYGFVARSVGERRLASLNRIVAWAKGSPGGADFDGRFTGGAAGRAEISLRAEITPLIGAVDVEAERDFYAHLVAIRMDSLEDSVAYADMVNRLGELTAEGTDHGAAFADLLCRRARVGAGTARVWTRASLLAELRALITLKSAPCYGADVDTLRDLAVTYAASIRQDIDGVALRRDRLVDEAQAAAAQFSFSNVSGLPGCGKSVVLRHLVERAIAAGPVLFLKSDRIGAPSWRAFATAHGLEHRSPVDILAEIGASGTPVLFIDGIDRIKPMDRGVILDLLRAIEIEPSLAQWTVVASSRDQGLEAFRQWIPSSLYKTTGIGDVPVPPLNEDEAERLAREKPLLRQLLFGSDAAREIARRPFFAAVLADRIASGSSADEHAAPQSENELISAWWRAGGYNAEPDAVLSRQRALIDLAQAGAGSLGKAIRARRLNPATVAQMAALKTDFIVEDVEPGSVFSFAHDIFFEWAFLRLLIDRGDDWPAAIVDAGEPPLLARVVGLMSQQVFEANGSWAEGLAAVSYPKLRPQWRRAWLLGAPASTRFLAHASKFEHSVLANGAVFLLKFLVWFQAERTIPNPLFLKTAIAGLEGAALVRAADRFGWPSDLPLWQRVLAWILAREASFPALASVHAVELFSVFQNMWADVANPFSQRLLDTAEKWLLELEEVRIFANGRPTKSTRWDDLPDAVRAQLVGSLRQLLLRSGRAYPDHARRVVERALALDRRSQEEFEAIVLFAPILATICPGQLADLVRVEVYEKLPQQEIEEARNERARSLALLEDIRTKPEAERSESDRRILSSPSLFTELGSKTYDFDDLGIHRYHGSYFPPTPLHQPFASLFEVAPDVARKLVRDIGNRATTAWRQLHKINAPDYGEPLPVEITFPWGVQRFWGDGLTYAWYLGEGGPQPLEAAFLALTYWAHRRLDAGDAPDEVIRAVLVGHESWAALGLAASLALEGQRVSAATLPIVTCQRLWSVDISRQVTNPGRPLTVLGMNPRDQMSKDQQAALDYLLARQFRGASIRDLVPLFALGSNRAFAGELKSALERFPENLPFSYAEERQNESLRRSLREMAKIWAALGDRDNYKCVPAPHHPGCVAVEFEAPESPSEEFELASTKHAEAREDMNVLHWADQSLCDGALHPSLGIAAMVAFARSRDNPDMFEILAPVGEGFRQSAVAAAAAVVAYFAHDEPDLEWAWSVLSRVARISEQGGRLHSSNSPVDPRRYLIAAIFHCTRVGRKRPECDEQLLTLASDPNRHIAQHALSALFRLNDDAKRTWIALALASELFVVPSPELGEGGERDFSAQDAHRAQARSRAIDRLREDGLAPLAAPPEPWVLAPYPRRPWDTAPSENVWRHPDRAFAHSFAAAVATEFPVEEWLRGASAYKPPFLSYLEDLVEWTAKRMFPAWREADERSRHATDLYQWLRALANIVVRASAFLVSASTIQKFISPIAAHDNEDALRFVAKIVDGLVCRGVYDAPTVTEDTMTVLSYCVERMLQEATFKSDDWRAGRRGGSDPPEMIKALLMVSVQGADGATRFANGDWSDLPIVMPLIDRVMEGAGWLAFVMDTYLTLCERADAAMSIDAFTRHVSANIDLQHSLPLMWGEGATPARIAGVVQRLAEVNYPLLPQQARSLLCILDRLVDIGDRRAAALQQSEYFRSVRLT